MLGGGALAVALALVLFVALRPDGSPPVGDLELVDLPVHEMVVHLALGLDLPYVLELPDKWPTETHDLRLSGTTARRVLEEIRALDPRYDVQLRPGVIVYWAGPELAPESPFATRLGAFRAEGSASSAAIELVKQAGLAGRLAVLSDPKGSARPVAVDLPDCTVRDVLAEIAAQAHLGMRVDGVMIRLTALPE
jgi:hypothetical protein